MTEQQSTRSCLIGGSGKKWTTTRWLSSRRWPWRRGTRFANVMGTERSFKAASWLRRTDMRSCGSTLAASTSEAVQSYPRPSIPCIGGMKTQKYTMRTSTTSSILSHCERQREVSQVPGMAGVVLAWVDATRAHSPKERSVPQRELAKD